MIEIRKLTKEELQLEHTITLRALARHLGVRSPSEKQKDALIDDILGVLSGRVIPCFPKKKGAPSKEVDISKFFEEVKEEPVKEAIIEFRDSKQGDKVTGILEILPQGYGFLRVNNCENSIDDVYVSNGNILKYNLKKGDKILAEAKQVNDGDARALQRVLAINDVIPQVYLNRRDFDSLVPYYPNERFDLEISDETGDLALRCIDIFSPIGMGQRGLIVAPPKTGKTTILKKIAKAIETNYPNAVLFVVLVDERPEEVTDIKRSVNSEVIFSTFDEKPEHHIKIAELAIERAKRLLEIGKDVIVLMDSMTRLARAYNTVCESSGKTLSGGLDPRAMIGPKRLFGSARNIEDGGSLTILSTVLVDTGSRMDDVVYEELKGTGNMEIHLSRELSEKRIFPAIDLKKSGTRQDELLLDEKQLSVAQGLRRILLEREDATDSLLEMMKKAKDEDEFVEKAGAWLKIYNS